MLKPMKLINLIKEYPYTTLIIIFLLSVLYSLYATREKSVDELLLELQSDSFEDKSDAVEKLGELGDKKAVEPLIRLLQDDNSSVRSYAAEALGRIGDARAIDPLINILHNDDGYLRGHVIEALGSLKARKSTDLLISLLIDEDYYIRKKAIIALGNIGDKKVIPSLEKSLMDWYSGGEAAIALTKLNWKPYSIDSRIHFFVAKKYREQLEQNWTDTKRVLLEDIRSNNSIIIRNALYTFIGIGNSEIIPELIESLNEHGTKVTAEAYLNSGHKELSDAAELWAYRNGYEIVKNSYANSPVNWGRW